MEMHQGDAQTDIHLMDENIALKDARELKEESLLFGNPNLDIHLMDESMALKDERKLKEEPLLHVFEGEDEREGSLDLKRKVEHGNKEPKTEKHREVKTEPKRSDSPDQQQVEDDRVSTNIL